MDTAFYNRTGFTGAWSFSEVNFYPKSALAPAHPPVLFREVRPRSHPGRRRGLLHTGIRFNVTRQGFFNFSHGRGHESWLGTVQGRHDFLFFGSMQVMRWLNLGGELWRRPGDLLRRSRSVPGPHATFGIGGTFQPNQHLSESLEFSRVRFWRPATGEDLRRQHRQFADDVSVRQAFPGAVAAAVRQLARTHPDRSPGFVRVRARHRVSCRLWVAVRSRIGEAPCVPIEQGQQLPDGQPRPVPQSVVPSTVLGVRSLSPHERHAPHAHAGRIEHRIRHRRQHRLAHRLAGAVVLQVRPIRDSDRRSRAPCRSAPARRRASSSATCHPVDARHLLGVERHLFVAARGSASAARRSRARASAPRD